jgi:hypothetical protein
MRYILTSLFVFSISFAALSQTSFEYLDPNNERNVAIQAFETKHNEYIISFVTIDNNISNCQNGILLLSEGGNKLSHSFFCNDTLELNAYDFFEMEDDLAIVGTGFNPVTEKSYLWFRKVDEEDSTITETFHYLSNREILLFDSFLKEGVFYCAGTTFDFEPFVATLETNGQLLFSKTDFEFIDVVNKLLIDENEYIMRGNRLRRLDAAFNLLEVMPNSPFGFHQQGDMIELSDSTYLITGKKTFAYSAENRRQFGIGILSDEFEELDSLLFGPGGDTIDYPGANRSISKALDGNFFFAGTSNMQIIPSPYGTIPSWFYLAKIEPDLTMLWNKTYGGDAYYNMYGVLATSDGGCLMYGFKHDYENEPNLLQLYVLKVNEDGDIISSATHPLTHEPIARFYPNPFSDVLQLEFFDPVFILKTRLDIYDSAGRLVIAQDNLAADQVINTSSLAKGVYFAKLVDDNGRCLLTEKLVKQ